VDQSDWESDSVKGFLLASCRRNNVPIVAIKIGRRQETSAPFAAPSQPGSRVNYNYRTAATQTSEVRQNETS
jgi:hypothetical protein